MRFDTAIPVGRGGSGEVLKAWDPTLRRHIALKLLSRNDPEAVERMLREARAQARVEHPNVGRIYEVGELDGRPFIAMQFIEGEALNRAAEGLPVEAKARLARDVALGVQAAHAAGLIHRDLKPANILVERQEDGSLHPWVLDFGIAREHDAAGLTATGDVLGTPSYMSPEQAAGESQLDRRSDVFSLGVVLYELLAGRLPFRGESQLEVVASVLRDEPEPLHRVASQVPDDLATITMTCLERDQGRRYPSARALADDLDRFLEGRPVEASPPSLGRRWARWVQRNRALAAVAAVAFLALVAMSGWLARESWLGQRRQELARRIGSELEQIDAALRATHLSPSHDRRPATRAAKRRADVLVESLQGEPVSPGLAAYVQGRVAVSLGRFSEARRDLEAAWQAGQRPEDLRALLGRSLAELYEQETQRARRLRNPDKRAEELARLAGELRNPALEHLARAADDELYPAQLVEARIALLEERWDDAVTAAQAALEAAPWLYEALLVVARVHLLQAADLEATGEHTAARQSLQRASPVLERAVAVGRSDPRTHTARCLYWARVLDLQRATGGDLEPAYREILETCGEAVRVDPETAGAWYQQARAHWRLAERLQQQGKSPEAKLEELRLAAERASDLAPDDHLAPNLLGIGLWQRARFEEARGADPRESLVQALVAFERSQQANPAYRHPYNNRANVLLSLSDWQANRGLDARGSRELAVAAYEEAISVDPEYVLPRSNISVVLRHLGQAEVQRGGDPHPYWERAAAHLATALELNPRYWNALNHRLLLTIAQIHWWVRRDRSRAAELISQAHTEARAAVEVNPAMDTIRYNHAKVYRLAALAAWLEGEDPEPQWRAADELLEQALELDPSGGALEDAAKLAFDRARASLSGGTLDRRQLRAAQRYFERCLAVDADLLACRYGLAQTRLARTAWEGDPRNAGSTEASKDDGVAGLATDQPDLASLLGAWREARSLGEHAPGDRLAAARECSRQARQSLEQGVEAAEAQAVLAFCDLAASGEGGAQGRLSPSLEAALANAPTLSFDPLFPRSLE